MSVNPDGLVMFTLKSLSLTVALALLSLPAFAAQPLKGSIRTEVKQDYIKEVQSVFAQFKDRMQTSDINVMNLYDPKAHMTFECLAPEGPQKITLQGAHMRQFQQIQWKLNPSMVYVPMASFKQIQSVNPKLKNVPMIKVDYTVTPTTTAPSEFQSYTMILARQPVKNKKGKIIKYEWRITQQSASLPDPQSVNVNILTLLQKSKDHTQVDSFLQNLPSSTAASTTAVRPTDRDSQAEAHKPYKKKYEKTSNEAELKSQETKDAATSAETPEVAKAEDSKTDTKAEDTSTSKEVKKP